MCYDINNIAILCFNGGILCDLYQWIEQKQLVRKYTILLPFTIIYEVIKKKEEEKKEEEKFERLMNNYKKEGKKEFSSKKKYKKY